MNIKNKQTAWDIWQTCDVCFLYFPVSMMHWIHEGEMLVCERCGKNVIIKYDNSGGSIYEQDDNQEVQELERGM